MKLKLVNVHVDYAYVTKGHMKEAVEILGTTKLGWFHEDHYNTHSVVFFDANQHTVKQVKELYAPYEQFGDEEKTEWLQDYIDNHGWNTLLVFDLDKRSVVSAGEIPETLPENVLIVHYWDTQNVPEGNNLHDIEEEIIHALGIDSTQTDLNNDDWIEEVNDRLPAYLQTVHKSFHYREEDNGIVEVNEEGAVKEA